MTLDDLVKEIKSQNNNGEETLEILRDIRYESVEISDTQKRIETSMTVQNNMLAGISQVLNSTILGLADGIKDLSLLNRDQLGVLEDSYKQQENQRDKDELLNEERENENKPQKAQKAQRIQKQNDRPGFFDDIFSSVSKAVGGLGLIGIVARHEQMSKDVEQAIKEIYSGINGAIASFNLPHFLRMLQGILKISSLGILNLTGIVNILANAKIPIISDLVKGVLASFSIIGKFFDGLLSGTGKIARAIGDLPVLKSILKFVSTVLFPLKDLVIRFGKVLGRFSVVFTVVIGLYDAFVGARDAFKAGKGKIGILFGAIRGFVNGFISIVGDIGTFLGWITNHILQWAGVSKQTSERIQSFIVGIFDKIEFTLSSIINFFLDINQWIFTKIDNFVTGKESLSEIFQQGLTGIIDFVNSVPKIVAGFFSSLVERFSSFIPASLSLDIESVKSSLNSMFNIVNNVWENIQGFFKEAESYVGNKAKELWGWLNGFFGKEKQPEINPPATVKRENPMVVPTAYSAKSAMSLSKMNELKRAETVTGNAFVTQMSNTNNTMNQTTSIAGSLSPYNSYDPSKTRFYPSL